MTQKSVKIIAFVYVGFTVVVCFVNFLQRNKLNTYNIKYNYHIMIIQYNKALTYGSYSIK